MSLFIPSFSVLLIKENDRLKMMKIVGIRRVQRRRSKKQKQKKNKRRTSTELEAKFQFRTEFFNYGSNKKQD